MSDYGLFLHTAYRLRVARRDCWTGLWGMLSVGAFGACQSVYGVGMHVPRALQCSGVLYEKRVIPRLSVLMVCEVCCVGDVCRGVEGCEGPVPAARRYLIARQPRHPRPALFWHA